MYARVHIEMLTLDEVTGAVNRPVCNMDPCIAAGHHCVGGIHGRRYAIGVAGKAIASPIAVRMIIIRNEFSLSSYFVCILFVNEDFPLCLLT